MSTPEPTELLVYALKDVTVMVTSTNRELHNCKVYTFWQCKKCGANYDSDEELVDCHRNRAGIFVPVAVCGKCGDALSPVRRRVGLEGT